MKFQNLSLGQKVKVLGGFAFKSDQFTNKGIPIVRISNIIGDGTVDLSQDIVYYPASNEAKEFELKESDIVLAMSGATTGKVGRIQKRHIPCLLNQRVAKFVLKDDSVLLDYLFWILRSPSYQKAIWSYAAGCAQPNISSSQLEAIKVSIPDKDIQKRIVSLLFKAESVLEKRRQTIRLSDQFIKSVFLEMFGEPMQNQKKWKESLLVNSCDKITDGEHVTPIRIDKGIMLLSARNVQNGYIDVVNESVDYIPESEYERIKKRCYPEFGDVLLSCSGSIGRVTRISIKEQFSLVRSVALIKPSKELLKSEYLEAYLQTAFVQSIIDRSANKSSQANIFLGPIKQLPVLLPPIDLQQKFADLVQKVEKLKEKQKQSETQLQNLFNSLMQRAFQ